MRLMREFSGVLNRFGGLARRRSLKHINKLAVLVAGVLELCLQVVDLGLLQINKLTRSINSSGALHADNYPCHANQPVQSEGSSSAKRTDVLLRIASYLQVADLRLR